MALVMAQMPDVWRKVLAEHIADHTGRCAACRNANGETASWPCQTYRVAQEAKWVSEGNLPGTGPHGTDVNASPRVSPPSQPFPTARAYGSEARSTGSYGYDLPPSGGFGHGGPSTGSYGYDFPSSGGFGHDGPSTGGYGHDGRSTGSYGYDLPPSSGPRYEGPSTGGFGHDGPSTGGYGYGGLEGYDGHGSNAPSGLGNGFPTDRYADDAATTFGGREGHAPALASLPPLPPSTATPRHGGPRHGSPDQHGSWTPEPSPYGPAYGSPSSEPDPLSAPSPGFTPGAGFGEGPGFDASEGVGARPGNDGFGGNVWPADPFASEGPRRSSWGGDESRPYGSTVDAPYGSTFGVDDRPRGSRR